jgi:hypothetical protein
MTGLALAGVEALPRTLAVHRARGAEGRAVDHPAEQTITVGRGGSEYARVIVRGHLDHDAAQRLRAHLGVVLDTGARFVTVDVSGVRCCEQGDCCEETVLEVLCWAARRACAQQGWLSLTGGHPRIRFAGR